MRAQLIMAFGVEAFDGRVLDRSVQSLDLTVGPNVVGFGQEVLVPIGFADPVKAHRPGINAVAVAWLRGELDAAAIGLAPMAPP